jgi:hypothetical protein
MNYVKINGISYDVEVSISDYEETFTVLDGENAGRAKNGRMVRDVIGTYIGHKVTFFNRGGTEGNLAFDKLWDDLVALSVNDSVTLEAADGNKQISYEAYYTTGNRKLDRVLNGVNYWDVLQISFVPMEAQITP